MKKSDLVYRDKKSGYSIYRDGLDVVGSLDRGFELFYIALNMIKIDNIFSLMKYDEDKIKIANDMTKDLERALSGLISKKNEKENNKKLV